MHAPAELYRPAEISGRGDGKHRPTIDVAIRDAISAKVYRTFRIDCGRTKQPPPRGKVPLCSGARQCRVPSKAAEASVEDVPTECCTWSIRLQLGMNNATPKGDQ